MKTTDFCEVCTYTDVENVEKVLRNLVVLEKTDGTYSIAMLDSGDHFGDTMVSFDTAPATGVFDEEDGDDEFVVNGEGDEVDIFDIHIENIQKLMDAFDLEYSSEVIEAALEAGFEFKKDPSFSNWLYNEIGRSIEKIEIEKSSAN